jgi:hypothetical protein
MAAPNFIQQPLLFGAHLHFWDLLSVGRLFALPLLRQHALGIGEV